MRASNQHPACSLGRDFGPPRGCFQWGGCAESPAALRHLPPPMTDLFPRKNRQPASSTSETHQTSAPERTRSVDGGPLGSGEQRQEAQTPTVESASRLARLDEHAKQLRSRIWITRGARLNAHRRLMEANDWSSRATNFLSMYSIVAALAVAVPQFGLSAGQKEIAAVALTALSVFTLVLSLSEAQRDYAVKAERLHRNARELGALLERLNLLRASSTDPNALEASLTSIGGEYVSILDSCPENHDPIDDAAFRAQHRGDFGINKLSAWWTSRVSAQRPFLLFYAFVFLPPLAAVAFGGTYLAANP